MSTRSIAGAVFAGLLTVAATASPAAERPAGSPAADAIVRALDSHRIVAIGENHGHVQFHTLLLEVLRDARVQAQVDDVVVEFGNARYQPLLDRYVAGRARPDDDIRRVWRDTVVSPGTVWDSPVYESFFAGVREINADLPADRRYRVLAGDVPVDWDEVGSADDLRGFGKRSEHMFDVLRNEVLRKGRRAIFVAGGAHVGRVSMVRTSKNGLRWADVTPVARLELHYPASVYVVMSMGRAGAGYDPESLAGVPLGAVVEIDRHPLGRVPANEITTMRNYDGSRFTLYGDARFASVADAVVYWGDAARFERSEPDPAIYQDDAWWNELNRRALAVRGQRLPEVMREQRP